jgi:hypothetical protein
MITGHQLSKGGVLRIESHYILLQVGTVDPNKEGGPLGATKPG